MGAPHALNPSWPRPQRFLLRPQRFLAAPSTLPDRALNASCCAPQRLLAAPSTLPGRAPPTAIEFCGGGNRAGVENAERLVALDALAQNPRESDWRGTRPPLTASIALTIVAFSRCWPSSTLAIVGHGEDYGANYITHVLFSPFFELTGRL